MPALGYAAQSGPETPVPIASLTKMANARGHPPRPSAGPGAHGPTITITQADAAEFDFDIDNDESNIPIQAGEMLTERQMLEALMNQSANDIAYSLAVWDAGTMPAFVAKMNASGRLPRRRHTHYVDASGYDPQSVSTASDSLRIAAAGMRIPAFAQVVGLPTVTLPLVGTVHNIVTQIGSQRGGRHQVGLHLPGRRLHGAGRVPGHRRTVGPGARLGAGPARPCPGGPKPTPRPRPVTLGHPAPTPSTTTTTVPTTTSRSCTRSATPGPSSRSCSMPPRRPWSRCRWSPVAKCWCRPRADWGGTSHRVAVVATQGRGCSGWPGQTGRLGR